MYACLRCKTLVSYIYTHERVSVLIIISLGQTAMILSRAPVKILVDCMTYRGQGSHASARTNTHKPMLWCEELSVYCPKLSVDWHRCPLISCIILGSRPQLHKTSRSNSRLVIQYSVNCAWNFLEVACLLNTDKIQEVMISYN